jgi:hypothetical protein
MFVVIASCRTNVPKPSAPQSTLEPTSTSAPGIIAEQPPHIEVIDAQTQRIGPLADQESGEDSTYEIHLQDFGWSEINGQAVITVSLQIKNLGPTGTKVMNQFYLVDQQGSTGSYSQIDSGSCGFKSGVFLLKAGLSQQCIAFSGAKASELTLVYAPYHWHQFDKGRYVAFQLVRPGAAQAVVNSLWMIFTTQTALRLGIKTILPYTIIALPQIGQKMS